MIQALELQQLAKGISPDEATLKSEEIKPITIVVIKLCLSEDLSQPAQPASQPSQPASQPSQPASQPSQPQYCLILHLSNLLLENSLPSNYIIIQRTAWKASYNQSSHYGKNGRFSHWDMHSNYWCVASGHVIMLCFQLFQTCSSFQAKNTVIW